MPPKKKSERKPNSKQVLKPTLMMIKTAQALTKQVKVGKGRVSVAQAGREAGYSESYINAGAIQRNSTFRELMKESIPEARLAEKMSSLLEARTPKTYEFSDKVPSDVILELMTACSFITIGIRECFGRKFVSVAIPDGKVIRGIAELWLKVEGAFASDENEKERVRTMGAILGEIEARRKVEKKSINDARAKAAKLIEGKVLK